MTAKKKTLPVGIDSFEKIINSGYYYLDKTMFIKTLIDTAGEVNLFTRPRRFGKTLTMSMLKSFFEIGSNPELFHGLAIEQEKELCEKYQGKFPVVSISLKGISGLTYESAIEKMQMLISTECKRLKYLVKNDSIDSNDRYMFELLRNQQSNETQLMYSLCILMRMLHTYHGKKVILLIDEYDVPLDKSNENGYYNRMIEFLRTFFGEALKSSPDLHFAVITGCLRISKESIFTGINNLKIDSISDKRFDEYFGFTDENVKMILKDYGLCNAYQEIRDWYDGYHFGNTDVYCPWDVINHCDKLLADPDAAPQAYWNNTSSNNLVKLFISKADNHTREDIEKLIAGEAIERPLTENLTYIEIDKKLNNLWSVLYLTGYLTRDREKKAENPGCVRLVIPNKEIRTIFIDKIKNWFEEKIELAADTLNEMYHALLHGESAKVKAVIDSLLRFTISYHDYRENFYHGFLIGLLTGNQDWILRSNRENGDGRTDITMESYGLEFGIVIEIKYAKTANEIDAKCEEALSQIKDKKYASELLVLKDTVWAYGIAFTGKTCSIKAEKLK